MPRLRYSIPGTVVTSLTRSTKASCVTTAFGRYGDVIAEEGDYSIDQMGDVDTTTVPPQPENVFQWNGTNWISSAEVDGGVWA